MPVTRTIKTALIAAAAATGVIGVAATAPVAAHQHRSHGTQAPNIVQTAQSTGVHETLVAGSN